MMEIEKVWYIVSLERCDPTNILRGFTDNQFLLREYIKQWSPAFSFDKFVVVTTDPMIERELFANYDLNMGKRIRSYLSIDKDYKVYMTPHAMMTWVIGDPSDVPPWDEDLPFHAGDLIGIRNIPKVFKKLDLTTMRLISMTRLFDGSLQADMMEGYRVLLRETLAINDSHDRVPPNVDHIKLLGYINHFPEEVTRP